MTPLRVVLLGASGFVGGAVLRQLAAWPGQREAHVLRHRRPLAGCDYFVTPYRGSLQDLPREMFPREPHVVIHCATRQIDDDGRGFAANAQGIRQLLGAVNSQTRAILYASSYSVYGEGPQRAVDESAPLQPQTALAESRAECERLLAEFAAQGRAKALIFRTRFLIGLGDRHFLPGLVKLARRRLAVGDGEQRYSVIDVDDYARAMLQVAQRALIGDDRLRSREVFNVGYERPISLNEIRDVLAEVTPLLPPLLKLPADEGLLLNLERLPVRGLRRLANRLRLLGHDHYGQVHKLQSVLDEPVLAADPREAVRRAAAGLVAGA